jgi:hypothetical protein
MPQRGQSTPAFRNRRPKMLDEDSDADIASPENGNRGDRPAYQCAMMERMRQQDLRGSDTVLSDEDRQAIRDNGTLACKGMQITVEGDLVQLENSTGMEMAELIYVMRVSEEVMRLRGRFFMLAVVRGRTRVMPPEQRQLAAQWSRKHPSCGTAVVNDGNAIMNTMISLLIRAVNLVISRPIPLAFFQAEPEARAWLEALRQKP